MSRQYPRWDGVRKLSAAFGKRVPMQYRQCCVCGAEAKRIGTVQIGWSRSDDQDFPLCGANECRLTLKRIEGVEDQ